MDKLTLEQIKNESLWIVKYYSRPRVCCLYSEINRKDDDIRDIDLAAQQPEHLQPFFNSFFEYTEKNGFMTIQDYYKIWVEEG